MKRLGKEELKVLFEMKTRIKMLEVCLPNTHVDTHTLTHTCTHTHAHTHTHTHTLTHIYTHTHARAAVCFLLTNREN